MFEKYSQLQQIDFGSKNKIYSGYIADTKVFIKQYVVREDREEEDRVKALTEIDCYESIKALSLPKLIEANREQLYLVLEWLDFIPLGSDRQTLATMISLWETAFPKIDASFLPKVTFQYYMGSLFARARKLEQDGWINSASKLFTYIDAVQTTLTEGFASFSHGDFYPGNIKSTGSGPVLFDFEHARRDSCLYDIACLEVYFFATPEHALMEGVSVLSSELDRFLFRAMIVRRCIEVLYALRGRPSMDEFVRARDLIATLG